MQPFFMKINMHGVTKTWNTYTHGEVFMFYVEHPMILAGCCELVCWRVLASIFLCEEVLVGLKATPGTLDATFFWYSVALLQRHLL